MSAKSHSISIAIFFLAWGLLAGWLSLTGALEIFSSRALLAWGLVVPPGVAICICRTWPPLCQFAHSAPLRVLTLAETPRVIGGAYILWDFTRGLLPAQFAMPTGISDIIFGLSALPAAFLLMKSSREPKRGFLTWHLLSFGFLIVSSVSGMLTSPPALHSFPAGMVPVFLGPLMILIEMAALAQICETRSAEASETTPLRFV